MKVCISNNTKAKVYHLIACHHADKILIKNYIELPEEEAIKLGYSPCRDCFSLKGAIRALTGTSNTLGRIGAHRKIEILHHHKSDTLYMRTENGFWKTYWKDGSGLVLYHLNHFNPALPTELLRRGKYHYQSDKKPTYDLNSVLKYVQNHDKAMLIIADDYRKLPHKTKCQRKYFRQAERRSRNNETRRVLNLIEQISHESARKALYA